MKTNRYIFIDIVKFIYVILIAVFHFCLFYNQPGRGGYIAVELFFMISGFLLANSFEMTQKKGDKICSLYLIKHKLWDYYPHYLFPF